MVWLTANINMRLNLIIFLVFAVYFNHINTDSLNDDNTDGADNELVGRQCTADEIIDKMLDWFTPDDYEEGKANIKYEINSLNETQQALQRLEQYNKNVTEKTNDISRRLNARLTEAMMEVDLSPECLSSLARIGSAARNGELWALKCKLSLMIRGNKPLMSTGPVLDAQPRPLNGILELSGIPLGNYDQCLSIESPDEPNQPKIRGQYCGSTWKEVFIKSPNPRPEDYPEWAFKSSEEPGLSGKILSNLYTNLANVAKRRTHDDWLSVIAFVDSNIFDTKLLNGICIPTTCSPREVSRVINKMTYPITNIPAVLDGDCDYEGKPVSLNKFHIISLTGMALMVTIFVVSSAIDCLDEKTPIRMALKGSSLEFIIECFSLKRNAKSVFSVAQNRKFKSLDALRAILTFYIVVVHTYEFGLIFVHNKNYYFSGSYQIVQDYKNMFVPNILIMDTFYLISAFLLGYMMLSKMERGGGRFNYFHYIIYRYFRLLPIILVGLAFNFIFELLVFNRGPIWSFVLAYFTEQCYDKWYKPLLMYSNIAYYPNENSTALSSNQCLTVSWYISCEMQLFALAPLSWLALYKFPRHGLAINIALLVFSVLLPVFNRQVLGFPHTYELLNQTNLKMLGWIWLAHYSGPFNYIQTYIIGILLGYAVRRHPKLYFGGRIGEAFIWMATILSSLSLLYWQRNFVVPGYQFDWMGGYEMPVYLVVHKLMYLSGFAWLIYACETGRGGWLYKAMCWTVFKFFDNVTFEIYMIHVFAFIYRIAVKRDQITYTNYYIWTSATFDYFATYVISVCVALVITRPFFHLTQALLQRDSARQVKTSNESKNTSISLDNPKYDAEYIKQMNIIHISKDKIIYRL